MKIFLVKQGWVLSSLGVLIAKIFTAEAADNASEATWWNKTQCVIGGADIAFQEHNDMLEASFVDTKHVYTD